MLTALLSCALSGFLFFILHVTGTGSFPRPLKAEEERKEQEEQAAQTIQEEQQAQQGQDAPAEEPGQEAASSQEETED